jgi:hypothetical protein
MDRVKRWLTLFMVLAMLSLNISTALAAFNNEAFENESYAAYGGKKDGRFTLTHMGKGGGRCDSNDQRFRVNVNRSYAGSDWKYYSDSKRYQQTPSGRPIFGFELNTTNAHICVGAKEFSSLIYGVGGAWTTGGVQSSITTWRR